MTNKRWTAALTVVFLLVIAWGLYRGGGRRRPATTVPASTTSSRASSRVAPSQGYRPGPPLVLSSTTAREVRHVMPEGPMPTQDPPVPWPGPWPARLEDVPEARRRHNPRLKWYQDWFQVKLRLLTDLDRCLGGRDVGAGEITPDFVFDLDPVTWTAEPRENIVVMRSSLRDQEADVAVVDCMRASLLAMRPIRMNPGYVPDGPWHMRDDIVIPTRSDRVYAAVMTE